MDYRWAGFRLVSRSVVDTTTPNGRKTRIVAEVRRPEDSLHFKIRAGREGPIVDGGDVGVPSGPEVWYEDGVAFLKAFGQAFVDASTEFVESERQRQRVEAERRAARVRDVVTLTDSSWADPLRGISEQADAVEQDMLDAGDAVLDEALDAAENDIGDQEDPE